MISLDAATDPTPASSGGVASLTFNHPIGAGTNRVLIVTVGTESATFPSNPVTSITYNGVAMTLGAAIGNPAEIASERAELWYMLEADLPAAGTYNVFITVATDQIIGAAISLFGVKQEAPIAVSSTTDVDSSTYSTNIATIYPNSWVVDVIEDNTLGQFTADPGQDRRTLRSAGGNQNTAATSTKLVPAVGTTTIGWTTDVPAARWCHALVAFGPFDSGIRPVNIPRVVASGGRW